MSEKNTNPDNLKKFKSMKIDISKNLEIKNSQSTRIRWGSNRMTMFDGQEIINKENNEDPTSNQNFRKFKVISHNVLNHNKSSEAEKEKKNNIEIQNNGEKTEFSFEFSNEDDKKNLPAVYTRKSIGKFSKREDSLTEPKREFESSGKGSDELLWDEDEQLENSRDCDFYEENENSSENPETNQLQINGIQECEEDDIVHSASSELNVTHSIISISSQDSLPSFSVQNQEKKSDRSIIHKGKFEESASRIKINKQKLKNAKQQNLKDGNLDGKYNIRFNIEIIFYQILLML